MAKNKGSMSLRISDLVRKSAVFKAGKKYNFTDMNKMFNTTPNVGGGGTGEEEKIRKGSFEDSILEEDSLSSQLSASSESSFGFSMETKQLLSEGSGLGDGGFDSSSKAGSSWTSQSDIARWDQENSAERVREIQEETNTSSGLESFFNEEIDF